MRTSSQHAAARVLAQRPTWLWAGTPPEPVAVGLGGAVIDHPIPDRSVHRATLVGGLLADVGQAGKRFVLSRF